MVEVWNTYPMVKMHGDHRTPKGRSIHGFNISRYMVTVQPGVLFCKPNFVAKKIGSPRTGFSGRTKR